jgi:hypothetical protein
MKYSLNTNMRTYEVNLPNIFACVEFSPIERLEQWLRISLDDDVVRDEVADEIVGVWISAFRSVDALSTALLVLRNDDRLTHICDVYADVLRGMNIEVKRCV